MASFCLRVGRVYCVLGGVDRRSDCENNYYTGMDAMCMELEGEALRGCFESGQGN